MPVRARQHHRPLAAYRIKILPRREALLRPVCLDPAPTDQRLPGWQRLGRLVHHAHQLRNRLDLIQVERHLALADAIEMRVGVGETRIEEGSS
jgi:hypothetical protein